MNQAGTDEIDTAAKTIMSGSGQFGARKKRLSEVSAGRLPSSQGSMEAYGELSDLRQLLCGNWVSATVWALSECECVSCSMCVVGRWHILSTNFASQSSTCPACDSDPAGAGSEGETIWSGLTAASSLSLQVIVSRLAMELVTISLGKLAKWCFWLLPSLKILLAGFLCYLKAMLLALASPRKWMNRHPPVSDAVTRLSFNSLSMGFFDMAVCTNRWSISGAFLQFFATCMT